MTDKVEGIRWKIEELDNQILDLIKKRMDVALAMGRQKVDKSMPVRDLRVEDQVISRYLAKATEVGISDRAARELALLLVRESVEAQAKLPRPVKPRKVLVIGGSGKMGRWFCSFFSSRGHDVWVYDPKNVSQYRSLNDLAEGARMADVICLATPISKTKEALDELMAVKTKALVFDIASVKSPLVERLRSATDNGAMVCSVHPMFGPDASSIFARNLILCDCGSEAAMDRFMGLLVGTGASVVTMPVEDHDRMIAVVLGMSHALNLAFFRALGKSGYSFEELRSVSSTTFEKQMRTSGDVSKESPELYYEIQHLNPFNSEMLENLISSLLEIKEAGSEDDNEHLSEIMRAGREYFEVK